MTCKWMCILVVYLVATFQLFAQSFTPTTTWPYLYEDFLDGTVFLSEGQGEKLMKLNVHLQHSTLHYVEGDKVMQLNPRNVESIRIGNDRFVYMDGGLVRLVKAKEGLSLVKLVKADMAALSKNSSGAYGMSTDVSAVDQLSSIQLGGISNLSHTQMKLERNDGKDLPVEEDYYFVWGDNKVVKATRKEVEKSLDDDGKAKLKAFVKQNKIKWKNEESLSQLLEFFQ